MRKGDCKKRGQVWAETWETQPDAYFLILGQEDGWYRLLSLEDGTEDSVWRRAIDRPASNWRRVT